jgi:hypothetical protein
MHAYCENEFFDKSTELTSENDDVLNWSLNVGGYWDGLARTNVSKALACLTHCFEGFGGKPDPYANLLWSLAGLEALLCDSSSSTMYQIRRRAPLIVKSFQFRDLDKSISRGYNFRSRLFHGDVLMRNKFLESDPDQDDDHDLDTERYGMFFTSLLNCALLECIETQATEVVFSETISLRSVAVT